MEHRTGEGVGGVRLLFGPTPIGVRPPLKTQLGPKRRIRTYFGYSKYAQVNRTLNARRPRGIETLEVDCGAPTGVRSNLVARSAQCKIQNPQLACSQDPGKERRNVDHLSLGAESATPDVSPSRRCTHRKLIAQLPRILERHVEPERRRTKQGFGISTGLTPKTQNVPTVRIPRQ